MTVFLGNCDGTLATQEIAAFKNIPIFVLHQPPINICQTLFFSEGRFFTVMHQSPNEIEKRFTVADTVNENRVLDVTLSIAFSADFYVAPRVAQCAAT